MLRTRNPRVLLLPKISMAWQWNNLRQHSHKAASSVYRSRHLPPLSITQVNDKPLNVNLSADTCMFISVLDFKAN